MIRVVTANLYNHHVRLGSLDALLEEEQPDLLAVQELTPAAAGVVRRRLPHGLLHPHHGSGGLGIAAASPVAVRRHRLPHRDAIVAQAGFDLWSVHLANPVGFPPPWRERRAQIRALTASLPETGPLLVVGDFNATPVWPAYRRLRSELKDGVAEWADRAGKRPAPTWTYRGLTPPLLRIDHAFTRGLTVVDARTRSVRGSDHRALVMDLEFGVRADETRSS
jgi:endonuclease/exonuclease/phosphatase (EEP) superfamily protein YafD